MYVERDGMQSTYASVQSDGGGELKLGSNPEMSRLGRSFNDRERLIGYARRRSNRRLVLPSEIKLAIKCNRTYQSTPNPPHDTPVKILQPAPEPVLEPMEYQSSVLRNFHH